MSKQVSSKPARGMRDVLPRDVELRQNVMSVIEAVYTAYGFARIETPAVENISLLTTGEGGENEKQLFRIIERGITTDDLKKASSVYDIIDYGLRFDLTIPLARYYADNQASLPVPFKAIQMGPVWRAERPQKGRFRQFTQCDIDIIGDETNFAEQELISATSEVLVSLGFNGFKVRVNDRRILRAIAEFSGCKVDDFDMIFIAIDKLDKIGIDGVEKELCDRGIEQKSVDTLIEFLRGISGDTEGRDLFAELPAEVNAQVVSSLREIISVAESQTGGKYRIVFDPTLVRGMGYYTGPIFEIEDKNFSVSIAGGGRYDKMIGKYTGKDVPACGFSIGFERIVTLLEERGYTLPAGKTKVALIFDPKSIDVDSAMSKAQELRKGGNIVCLQQRRKNMKKQIADLADLGYTFFGLMSNLEDINLKPMI
ncbi:MAG: histidine--tRNA ligase [bacterium]|nr:histidine--tRNA ligase [bacterium]